MPAQPGKDLLIRIDTTGGGSFQTVAGLRASRIAFNAETVDITNIQSAGGWRELLGGTGVRSASISGSGVFLDAETDDRARANFFDATVSDYQVVIPSFGTVEGPFQITSLEYSGAYDGEAVYEIALASAGQLTFVPAT
ncbi:MAG: phage major tail protein, TP901-1 family [Pseudomonadota bacterium]